MVIFFFRVALLNRAQREVETRAFTFSLISFFVTGMKASWHTLKKKARNKLHWAEIGVVWTYARNKCERLGRLY